MNEPNAIGAVNAINTTIATTTIATAAFITRWQAATGSERANHQLFLTELCALLGVPQPDPARDDTRDNAYVFERRVQFAHGDGSASNGFIDCYKRGHFVLEAKKVRAGSHTKGFDDVLLRARARAQAESYARALPASEGRPPFLMVVDVGHVISCTPSSPAAAQPTRRFLTRAATVCHWPACWTKKYASASKASGLTLKA